ncbi:ABC transporter G family protein [Tieghemostelium lacteum]|uniref:ABC transporter G family protein n=1 Tax=Tieghemostelium lacteum TaxID=361077 RepID=A0A151ZB14_TIELA|nr:ABC transporter G family protein [Tieghemostelium lacteum]|eukprot:KYQ91142.1 ABC transporter G family protein [Tieghemostelium lacteum]
MELQQFDSNDNKKNVLKIVKNVNRVDFTFRNINHSVQVKVTKQTKKGKKKQVMRPKQILHNMSGHVKSGEVLAIMGPSGAGKTTLLDILAHRLKINGEGVMYLNQSISDYHIFKKLCGYVTQSDTLTPSMTVFETLSFYAQLKMPREMPLEDKLQKVEDVISEMGLNRCRNTLVGDNLKIRGVSGGERRRLSIAVELLTSPSILFLDEPTSGLDSSTAYTVMNAIRKLANSGRTIICTIHQPRYNIFDMFDKLLLLAEGNTIYFGDTQKSAEYFESLGYKCLPNVNPADYYMDLINTQIEDDIEQDGQSPILKPNQVEGGNGIDEELLLSSGTSTTITTQNHDESNHTKHTKVKRISNEELNRFKKVFIESEPGRLLKEQVDLIEKSEHTPFVYQETRGPSFWTQFRLLFYRESLNARRHPMALRVQVFQAIFQGILCGLVYLQLGLGQNTVQSRTGVLAFVIMGLSFPNVMSTINVFPEVVGIFLKDRASNVYNTLPFFLAKSFMDIMLGIVLPIVTGTLVYWMSNQRIYPFYSAAVFFKFILVLVVASQCALSLGIFISSSVPNVQTGLAIAPLVVILFFLFSGFFVNLKELGRGWVWMPYISFFRYIIEAAVVNAYTNVTFSCTQSQMLGGRCPIQTGEEVISNYGFNIDNYWRNIGIILLYIVAFRCLTYMVLRIKSRNRF